MVELLLSLLALSVGPILFGLARKRHRLMHGVDGFAVVAVAGMVLFHVLPQTIAQGGWTVLLLAALGLIAPTWLHRLSHRHVHTPHDHSHHDLTHHDHDHGHPVFHGVVVLALLGLAIHAFLDGFALIDHTLHGHPGLNDDDHRHWQILGLAVILHRLPFGLALWWLVRPSYGFRRACGAFGLIATATVAGFYFGDHLVEMLSKPLLAHGEALIGGMLLHVVLDHAPSDGHYHEHGHGPTPQAHSALWNYSSGIGGLLGVGLIVALTLMHPLPAGGELVSDAADAFLHMLLESAPALLIAYLIAGAFHVFVPAQFFRWMRGRTRLSQSMRGMAIGLPVSLCSCGVIPVYRSLIGRGVPPAAAVAFLVAAPELGIAAIMLSFSLLGGTVTTARLIAAAVLAIVAGMAVGFALKHRDGDRSAPLSTHTHAISWRRKTVTGLRYGFGESVDDTAPWIVAGLAVAALAEPLLPVELLTELPAYTDVVLFTLIGMPLYVCASGSTPFAAMLLAKGLSPGAVIAFLLTGPATNVTTLGILSRLHGKRAAATFFAAMVAGTLLLGYAVNLVLPLLDFTVAVPDLDDAPGIVQYAAAITLSIIFIASFLRQGVRGTLHQILGRHEHDAPHAHAHDHHTHNPTDSACSQESCCP